MSSSVLLPRVPLRACKDREGHPVSSVVKCHLVDYQVSFVPWKLAQVCSGLISGPGDMVHACRRLYALSIQTHGRYHVINMGRGRERSSEIQEDAKLRRSEEGLDLQLNYYRSCVVDWTSSHSSELNDPRQSRRLTIVLVNECERALGPEMPYYSWPGNPEPGFHVAFSFPLT